MVLTVRLVNVRAAALVADERSSRLLYSFEDFSFDTARRELRRGGTLIALQPQVFDLLEYAIRNRERVVSKDDLLAAVWNGRIVSESTLSARINAARSAIGDSGEEQRLIRTAHGKGIRFVGTVHEGEETVRKLAAIFAADVAGYSRLMGQDEIGTLRRLTACRAILDERIAAYRGRIFGSAGDSVVADFASAINAVQCAVAVQEALAPEEQMRFRIGVHVGDVIVQGENLFGDGVNIAARLEALAEPGRICISGTVRDQIGTKLPIAFTDLGEQQVKNIAQPIRAYRIGGAGATAVTAPSLPLPDKPSIAVLPFQNLSGDPEQEYFADGMVEEIITALSGIRWLFVIARNSSFTYKGKPVDVRQVSRELGVRYVLEGSVRKAGKRVRIAAQLIDALTGAHLWAHRFDGGHGDVFELQDRVAASVAGVIEPTLQAAEMAHARHERPGSLDAYDLYLRALYETGAMTAESSTRALSLLRQALELDPGYAAASAQAAICYMWRFLRHWMADEEVESAEGVTLARASVAADHGDPTVLANAGCVLLLLNGDVDTAERLLDRAVALNPNSAIACGYSGIVRVWAGDYGVAIERCARAMRLSPLDPLMSRFLAATGRAHFCERRLEEALVWMRRAQDEHPTGRAGLEWLVSTYAHLGRLDEARAGLRHLLEESPRYTIAWNKQRLANFKKRADAEFLLEGLRMAGLAEE